MVVSYTSTLYFALNWSTAQALEINTQASVGQGTFVSLRANVIVNGIALNDSYLALRKNNADTPLLLIIPAGKTGIFSIEADVDVIESDLVNFRLTGGSDVTGQIRLIPILTFKGK